MRIHRRNQPFLLGTITLFCLLSGGVLFLVHLVQPARARQAAQPRVLMPIGGGYADIYADFVDAAITNAHDGLVNILILPFPAVPDPLEISDTQRREVLQEAEFRRLQIEEACTRSSPAELECQVIVAPILVRNDAMESSVLDYFTPDLSAIFILGGDPTVAMQVISGSPIESALLMTYQEGVIIAGTGAGGGLFSTAMIAGYQPKFSEINSLDFGAVDLWNSAEKHGIVFGLSGVMIEQQFFQAGRLGRLLNAISLPDSPGLGIGLDAYTGMNIVENTHIEDVFGLYLAAVLDVDTYHAANTMQYGGPDHTISLRNALVHLIPPGDFTYDLEARVFTSFQEPGQTSSPAYQVTRNYESIGLPVGAGTLIVSGGISDLSVPNPVLIRFLELNGGDSSRILIYADGFASSSVAQQVAAEYQHALGGGARIVFVDPENPRLPDFPAPDSYNAILLVGNDQSRLNLSIAAEWLEREWMGGKMILAENAAAAAFGEYYSAHGPTPNDGLGLELAAQRSFILYRTALKPGLNFLDLAIEPQVLGDNRWGRVFSLAYSHPEQIVLALSEDSAVEITPDGARTLGSNAVIVLDLRHALLGLGSNQAFAIANGLLDVFAPGEALQPINAGLLPIFTRAATPFIPTATATLAPSATPEPPTPVPTNTPVPTRTPRPTATPPTIPPPSNPDTTNLMVLVGALVVLVIVFGIWLNRSRVF